MMENIVHFYGGPWDGKHGDSQAMPRVLPYPYDDSGHYEIDPNSSPLTYYWREHR